MKANQCLSVFSFYNNISFRRCKNAKLFSCILNSRKAFCHTSSVYYDIIIVGGGHAGTESCAAAARMGVKTLLVTHKKDKIGEMSCNPSFGGIGKGHLMKEVDALDGLCGRICDISGVHYKILNKSKGPAVWGYRAQIDRCLYKKELQKELFALANLTIRESSVEDLILGEENYHPKCKGIVLKNGEEIFSNCVVLTTGTFLRGQINIGTQTSPAGRMGDEPAIGLARTLERLGFKLSRLRTGTPPRLDKNTIDFTSCLVQEPDDPPQPFSFMNDRVWIQPSDQLKCYITFTNEDVGKIVRDSLHLNRHVKEEVVGPRYCPSLESKVVRYPGREHQVWLEPEGLNSSLIYPQGLSCTMPAEIQQTLVRKLPGLERCEIVQPGYGVEYDFVNPQELISQLETKKVSGLFFAGQINGTTGYEEAAAQGIVAGINAAAKSKNRKGIDIDRTEGYIGVLIDDLTTHGTTEPYRMFTFRSEFRLKLRPDNADVRLTAKGYEVGCVSEERMKRTQRIQKQMEHFEALLKDDIKKASEWNKFLPDLPKLKGNVKRSAFEVLGLLPANSSQFKDFLNTSSNYCELEHEPDLWRRIITESHYRGPSEKEKGLARTVQVNRALSIPHSFDYYSPEINLSNAIREKLSQVRPTSIAHASRIPGVTTTAILTLLNFLKDSNAEHQKMR